MTEVPDYLLERSRERRAALGLETGAAPEAAAVVAATDAGPAAPTSAAPVPASAPQIEKVEPPKAIAPWVKAAQERKKIPVWMAPVAMFLPIWGFMVWGTLEEPTRPAEGIVAEGAAIYQTSCASCHGAGGGGGVGYQLNDGAVLNTFPDVESQLAWVVNGTDASQPAYGSPDRVGGQRQRGAQGTMPSFDSLDSKEILAVVLYERSAHGLASDAELEPYILWAESDGLPDWKAGISPQAIGGDFADFLAADAEAAALVTELAAE